MNTASALSVCCPDKRVLVEARSRLATDTGGGLTDTGEGLIDAITVRIAQRMQQAIEAEPDAAPDRGRLPVPPGLRVREAAPAGERVCSAVGV